jgi:galactofuranosylgalactofuranosylrhamnosyl-N-acetylglucosaminyl-diphospho-decaprenol beta-1,5/1,6-galactofuranosyltransferase
MSSPEQGAMVQRLVWDREPAVRGLYWRVQESGPWSASAPHGVTCTADGALAVSAGTTVCFDTYFNAFFEQQWRLYTRLGDLALRVAVEGDCVLRVCRRTSSGEAVIAEQAIHGRFGQEIRLPRESINFRQHGLLHVELTGTGIGGGATLREAAWVAANGAAADPVGLAIVFCTFNRERDIAAALAAIAADDVLLDELARVFVVNQGRPDLAHHPLVAPILERASGKIRIIEQGNFGGAGGFTRGLLAAMEDAEATHVAFIDDDVAIEPESLRRMAAFFGLATGDNPIGGHMLDRVQPGRVYEAGAVIDMHDWTFHPQLQDLDLTAPGTLEGMLGPAAIHYNGWWCFGFSLALVGRVGLPLPCFIRGDDMEFGLRLTRQGIHTIPMPGIAVWHEPFYLKIGGWQLYYETRNMLVAASLHLGVSPRAAVIRMARLLLIHLLTFRYYSARLIVRGIADFLRGPGLWDSPPQALHASLGELARRHPTETIPREAVLPTFHPAALPKGRRGYGLRLLRVLVRSTLARSPRSAPQRVLVDQFSWATIFRTDCVALDTWWDRELPLYHRSRDEFRAIGKEAARTLGQLWRRYDAVGAAWRDAMPRLTSPENWRRYLGVDEPAPPALRRIAESVEAAD